MIILSSQKTYCQNLLSNYKQDFIWSDDIQYFKPITEKIEVLNTLNFDIKKSLLTISNVTSEPILSRSFKIVSTENDEKNDTLNFTLNDENALEYLLMLSITKNKLIIIVEKDGKKHMTDYHLVVRK